MEKKTVQILLVILAGICLSTFNAYATTITFDVSDSHIEINESFFVDVYATGEAGWGNLDAFGFDVSASPSLSLFDYTGYDITNPDYWDTGVAADPNYVAGLWINDPPASNAGETVLLASLHFTAGAVSGTDTLTATGLFDPFDRGAFYEFSDQDISGTLDITIHEAAIPEPATALLFGLGIIGISGLSRRRHKYIDPNHC